MPDQYSKKHYARAVAWWSFAKPLNHPSPWRGQLAGKSLSADVV